MFKPINTLVAYGLLFVVLFIASPTLIHAQYGVMGAEGFGCDNSYGNYTQTTDWMGRHQYQHNVNVGIFIRFNGVTWEISVPLAPVQYYTAPDNGVDDPPLTGWNAAPSDAACTGTVTLCNGCMLPVELSYFKVEKIDDQAELRWATESEEDNMGFEIQRSYNGITWMALDFVKGQGTTDQYTEYRYTDESPRQGTLYYRLMQQDYDGAFEYSNVEVVDFDRKQLGDIMVYPNPAVDQVFFPNSEGQLIIYNQLGQVVHSEFLTNSNRTDISALRSGIYILEITTPNNQRSIGRFMKQTN